MAITKGMSSTAASVSEQVLFIGRSLFLPLETANVVKIRKLKRKLRCALALIQSALHPLAVGDQDVARCRLFNVVAVEIVLAEILRL